MAPTKKLLSQPDNAVFLQLQSISYSGSGLCNPLVWTFLLNWSFNGPALLIHVSNGLSTKTAARWLAGLVLASTDMQAPYACPVPLINAMPMDSSAIQTHETNKKIETLSCAVIFIDMTILVKLI